MIDAIEAALAVIRAGTAAIVSEPELRAKLALGRPLRIKAGFDPTAPDLHLGHTLLLRKLRDLQDLGHTVLFLIGDFTGRIGDPTGKNATRPPLSEEDVARNAESYERQVFKILDRERTEVVFNSQWMGPMKAYDLVKLASHYTVARLLERDDFEKRYAARLPIALHEFLYPLIQGYDSVALEADIELGGTDQRFNLLVGRELQRVYGQPPQVVITLPILEGTDGIQKMSKSLNNAIGVADPPDTMFGKLMSISDVLMWRYLELLSQRPQAELDELRRSVDNGANPRDVKLALAKELVARFHGAAEGESSQERFLTVFSRKALPDAIDERTLLVSPDGLPIARALKAAELVGTTSEALRLIRQGGVKVDGERAVETLVFKPGVVGLVQIGKRRFLRLHFSEKDA
ncbi:MAG TPA: tyrosine--tRNA ligase [Acidiferrobacter sp.]|nr:tyrosine--tRNA ligase [Acidiferrobacter sp.]